MRSPRDMIAAVGLGIGGVFGAAGTMVAQASLRQTLWTIDGAALVVATSLLTIRFVNKGSDLVAAGFLVFAIGEGIIVSSTSVGLEASVPFFGGGVALWSAGLLLTSIPREFAIWTRALGVVAASLFAIVAIRIAWGEAVLPTASPLPFFAYPVLVLTFAGWIWRLMTDGNADGDRTSHRV